MNNGLAETMGPDAKMSGPTFLLKSPKKTAVSMANSKQKHIFVISK